MAEALRHPGGPEEYSTGISVHQDGSCNGLQHYAALGRDEWGATAVNILPNAEVAGVWYGCCDGNRLRFKMYI